VEITSCDFISGTVPEVTYSRTLRNKRRDGLYLTPKKVLYQLHKLLNLLNKIGKIHTAVFRVRKPCNQVGETNFPEKNTALSEISYFVNSTGQNKFKTAKGTLTILRTSNLVTFICILNYMCWIKRQFYNSLFTVYSAKLSVNLNAGSIIRMICW